MPARYNAARVIRGWTEEFRVPAAVAAEIRAGDALVLVTGEANIASTLADLGTKAQNQEAAHDAFLGFSADQKIAGDDRDILVYSKGDAKLPCAALSQAYDVGQYFGLAGTGAAGAVGVSDYEVEPVATANLAICRLIERGEAGDTTVIVRFAGTLSTAHAGAQAMA